jgi:hypothetical protein
MWGQEMTNAETRIVRPSPTAGMRIKMFRTAPWLFRKTNSPEVAAWRKADEPYSPPNSEQPKFTALQRSLRRGIASWVPAPNLQR